MNIADLSIQKAFVEGINEVFSIMFTEKVKIYLLDTEKTKENIYGEAKEKTYKKGIEIVCKIIYNVSESNKELSKNIIKANITVPIKQLLENKILFNSVDDIRYLECAVFEHNGNIFEVDEVTPKTLIAEMWQMIDFNCSLKTKTSLKR